MKRPTLRWLILVPILAVVTCGLLGLSLYVDRYVQRDLIEQVDNELIRAEQSALARRTPPGAPDAPDRPPARERPVLETIAVPVELELSPEGELLDEAGGENPFSDADLVTIAELPTGQYTFDDVDYRIRTFRQRDGSVAVTALDLSSVDALISNLRRALLVGSLVVLVLQGVIVWLIASYLTRPLTKMTDSARRIASGELDTTIGEPSGSQETAALAVDLDQMLDQLRTTIEQSELSAAEAREARNQMERFLADASHELRTPLTALKGYADLYQGDMLQQPDALDRAMGRIGSESERMTRLVNDMLTLTRTGAYSQSDMAPADLAELVRDLVSDFRAAYPNSRIEDRVDPDASVMLLCDRNQIHQSLLNIAANAHHHTPAGTPIAIELDQSERHVTVRIVDRGPGIDPAVADKVFLPFYQADESRTRDGDAGAGLGLAITARIIEAHRGTVRVEATPGGGATFVVQLPMPHAEEPGPTTATIEQDSPLVATDG